MIRVVAYVRMSTLQQTDSPARQREQIEAYAARRGYAVAGWYEDLGISGARDDRPGFLKLLADAAAGRFDLILADEPSRLSRQDPIDFIRGVVGPLRDAGVRFETVARGPMNWDDLGGLIGSVVVESHAANGELVDKSRRTLTGQLLGAAAGRWMGGPVPYGFAKERVPNPSPRRPERTASVLVEGPPEEVKVVRWLFEQYGTRDRTLRGLVDDLDDRKLPPPGNRKGGPAKRWHRETIRGILRNPLYAGRLTWNRLTAGKFHKLAGGEAVEKGAAEKARRPGRKQPPTGKNPTSEWEVKVGGCPALVTPELFDAVQRRLEVARDRPTTPLPEGGDFVFTGLLFCGHCGSPMSGRTDGKGPPFTRRRVYRCGRYVERGPVSGCPGNLTHEKPLLRVVGKVLQDHLLRDELVGQLREEARRRAEADRGPERRRELEKLVAKLDAEATAAEKRLALLPDDVLAGAIAGVRDLKARRDAARSELESLPTTDPVRDLEAEIRDLRERLWGLREVLVDGDPKDVRIILKDLVARVVVTCEAAPSRSGKTVRTTLAGGVIETSANLPGTACRWPRPRTPCARRSRRR